MRPHLAFARFAGYLLVGLSLAGAAVAAPPDRCARVDVAATAGGKPVPPAGGKDKLSATAVEDVVFDVKLASSIDGDHTVTIAVFLPEGHLYQSLSAPVTVGGAPGKRRVAGYPFAMDVQVARKVTAGADAGKSQVSVTLPLAGTAIVSNSLYGTWQAQLYLDGAETPCADPVTFTITP
jgi:hypothetical protein